MESSDAASEMACPMVLQAVVGDRQLLLSLPLAPSTYQVVIARAVGADANESAKRRLLNTSLCFIIFSSFFAKVLGHAARLCLWHEYRHLTATEGTGNLELANRSGSFPCPFDVESSARSSRAAHGQVGVRSFLRSRNIRPFLRSETLTAASSARLRSRRSRVAAEAACERSRAE